MRFEWYIKQIIAAVNGNAETNFTLLTPERSTSVDGTLRYVAETMQVYVGKTHVYVDTPVYMFDTVLVMRAECPIVNDEIEASVIRAVYASANVFLKALFFHSVESTANPEEISSYYNCVRVGVIAAVRHFCQWLIDPELDKKFRTHSTDLLCGWLSLDMEDVPVHLRFSEHPDTGSIVFHGLAEELRPDDMTKYGWLTALVAPYQAGANKNTISETAVSELSETDLRLMYNAGCGRMVLHWELAVSALALPSLKSLIK